MQFIKNDICKFLDDQNRCNSEDDNIYQPDEAYILKYCSRNFKDCDRYKKEVVKK
ncbi:MAG: hypothetical protein JW870_01520 [Candidatus Delongbacteria bacterium]|nr:hypothetical protein [Candidatus Delongbacteria bacterium]